MINYILYRSEYSDNDCIAEVLNDNEIDMLDVQKQLLSKGYIIDRVNGTYIKCHKAHE